VERPLQSVALTACSYARMGVWGQAFGWVTCRRLWARWVTGLLIV